MPVGGGDEQRVPGTQSDSAALRSWRRGCIAFGAFFVLIGAGIAVVGAFTTSRRPQDLGGSGLYFVGGGIALAGVIIAVFTYWLGRRNGVRMRPKPPPVTFSAPRR